jgi:hypothetical protein
MATPLDCERVLATIDWSNIVLIEHELDSGYAVDEKLRVLAAKRGVGRARVESPSPGKFARYQRGDCAPNRTVLDLLDTRSGWAGGRFYHPLYSFMRVGWEGFSDPKARRDLAREEVRIERWLDIRLSRFVDMGQTSEWRLMTRPLMRALAANGTGYALAALLHGALRAEDMGENPKAAVQHAVECMVLAFARGEFQVTWPLVAARLRQQLLDRFEADGRVADTASLDLRAAVRAAREWLENLDLEGKMRPTDGCRAFYEWRKSESGRLLDIAFVPVEEAEAARIRHPVRVALEPVPRGQFEHVRDLGQRARKIVRTALGEYAA